MEVLCERHTLFSALTPLRPLSALGAMRARNSPLEGCPRIYGGRRLFETRRTKKMRLSGQSPSPEEVSTRIYGHRGSLIHLSAWKWNSPKFVCRIVHRTPSERPQDGF